MRRQRHVLNGQTVFSPSRGFTGNGGYNVCVGVCFPTQLKELLHVICAEVILLLAFGPLKINVDGIARPAEIGNSRLLGHRHDGDSLYLTTCIRSVRRLGRLAVAIETSARLGARRTWRSPEM